MTRIDPVNPETATGRTSELFQQVRKKMGRVPNLMQTLGHSPAALEGYLSLNESLSRGVLSAGDRERIALTVAEHHACGYCRAAHSAIGELAGLSAEQIDESRKADSADPQAAALLRFVRNVLDARGHIDDVELARFRAAGYSDAAVAEVAAHIGLNVLTNFFNSVAQTEIDFPHAAALSA